MLLRATLYEGMADMLESEQKGQSQTNEPVTGQPSDSEAKQDVIMQFAHLIGR